VGVEAPPDLVALLDSLMSALQVTDPAPWRDTAPWGWLLTARASRQRLTGDPAPDLWEAAVAGWRHIGFAWNALAATVPLVEDLHETGQRERAVELTTDGWHEARAMGARGLADAFEGLARRGRVRFEEPPDGDGPDTALVSRLTPREREVLDLVATGATNRAIGQALFISEKTVSVHLSNLMAKLGVTNRTEAAALARPEPPTQ
jgi:DNA-binding CsgD family transcriptional regulator